MCKEKPSQCQFIQIEQECGKISTKSGSRQSCEWKDNKCQFKGCNVELQYYSEKTCLKYNSLCKFDGFQCVNELQTCNTKQINNTNKNDCNKFISKTGRCQDVGQSYCQQASCYQYNFNSTEKCNQHYGQNGQQCIYNGNLFESLCLEQDYGNQIQQCIQQLQYIQCGFKLSISQCFNLNYYLFDDKIDVCFNYTINNNNQIMYYQYNIDCQLQIDKNICNQAYNQQMKKCQYNELLQICQTIDTCSNYIVNEQTTNQTCQEIHQDCQLLQKDNIKYCLQKTQCQFYLSLEECILFNPTENDLNKQCKWFNNKCKNIECYDLNQFECGQLSQCFYNSEIQKCQDKDNSKCNNFNVQDCTLPNCVIINNKCITVNQQSIYNLDLTIFNSSQILDNNNFICKLYQPNLIYNPITNHCHVKSSCENYDLNYCTGMIDYLDTQCYEQKVNSLIKCSSMNQCENFQYKTLEKCYQISTWCTTNYINCITVQDKCQNYNNKDECHFQKDSTKCFWDQNKCRIIQCKDLNTEEQCDSRNLCMDPSECQKNHCVIVKNNINNTFQCTTLKSNCIDYQQSNCVKSVQGYCYWNGQYCQDLQFCNQLNEQQCSNIQICQFNKSRNQCLDNSIEYNQYNKYCNSVIDRPLKI